MRIVYVTLTLRWVSICLIFNPGLSQGFSEGGIHMSKDKDIDWVLFTKRTNDPKLKWIEGELDKVGISHRRNGKSFHAPILEVPSSSLIRCWDILSGDIDHLPDDHEMFQC